MSSLEEIAATCNSHARYIKYVQACIFVRVLPETYACWYEQTSYNDFYEEFYDEFYDNGY